MSQHFRACAGAIVFNKQGLVLLGNRIETKDDAWQFPQGGIEQGESPDVAARRELFEETSVTSVRLIYTEKEPTRYEFDEEIKKNFIKKGIHSDGQDIYFSLFYFEGSSEEINVRTAQPEFREYAWKDFDFAVQNIIGFKKDVYAKAKKTFEPIIKQYLCQLS